MLDNRMYTFLELCNVLNYHKVAENLQMTQPAVTQHIKYLEQFYQCKLFDYSNRKLSKTKKGIILEKYARNVVSLHISVQEKLNKTEKLQINIGATKTIGEYLLNQVIPSLMLSDQFEMNFIIDNTENLLDKLNHFELDLLLLEGDVDKANYQYSKISTEEIVGICAPSHPFAHSVIPFENIVNENVVLREKGSGTRNVFERFLKSQGHSIESMQNKSILSSNKLIEQLVEKDLAISFVYDVIPRQNTQIASFRIKKMKMLHDFNFVYLNQEKADKIIDLLRHALEKV